MMMLNVRRAALVLGGLLFSALVHAQEFKIGVVDTERILRESAMAKSAQARLESQFAKREKDLIAQGQALKAAGEKFQREAPTMAENARIAREKQLIEQDRDFQNKRRDFQEDLSNRRNEELQAVQEKAMKVIKQLAESGKYDLIVQEAVYFNPKYDITDRVIQGLNASK